MTTLAQAYSMAHKAFTQKKLAEAESICTQILKQLPDHQETLYLLGHVRIEQRRINDARQIFDGLLKKNKKNPDILISLGSIEEKLGRYKDAIPYFEKALKLAPNNQNAQLLYCSMLEKTNQLDKAEKQVKKHLKNNPRAEMLHLHSVLLTRQKKYDEAITALESIDDTNQSAATKKYFELAKCHDKKKNYDQAFSCLTKAHEMRQKVQQPLKVGIDKNTYLQDIEREHEIFIKKDKGKQEALEQDINIHFMVGFPRSGTTLLHQMLDAHPNIEVTSEFPLIRFVHDKVKEKLGDYAKVLELDQGALKFFQDLYTHFFKQYLDQYEAHEPYDPEKIYIDKLPMNMTSAGLIHKIFPKAKFILSLRHPCDCALSNMMQNYQPNPAMENMTNLKDISNLYRKSFDLFFDLKDHLDLDVMECRYEDLINDYEEETARLCDFLGTKHSDEIKNYRDKITSAPKSINTPSYQQVVQPLYKDSKARWKNYETYFDEDIMKNFAPYIKKFGYEER